MVSRRGSVGIPHEQGFFTFALVLWMRLAHSVRGLRDPHFCALGNVTASWLAVSTNEQNEHPSPRPSSHRGLLGSVVCISQDLEALPGYLGGTIQVRSGDSPGPLMWQLPFMWRLPFQPDHGIPLLSHDRPPWQPTLRHCMEQ